MSDHDHAETCASIDAEVDHLRVLKSETDVELARLRLELRDCLAAAKPPVRPPVLPPDPPVIVPPDPPSGVRPGEDMEWGVRKSPHRGEYDWIARDGVLTSQRGLGTVIIDGGACGTAYRLSREAGHIVRPIVFGVWDDAGPANVGGAYSRPTSPSPKDLTWLGEGSAAATFVGLSPFAEVGLSWGYNGSRAVTTGSVEAYNIGIRNYHGGVYIVRANGHDRPGDAATKFAQMDGIWWLGKIDENTGKVEQQYLTGLHADDHDVLIIRNMKHRGKQPHMPGLDFKEHSNAYLKSIFVSLLFEYNDCYGGNRSGLQVRPEPEHNALPTARIMARGNFGDNIGDNHVNPSGGAVLSIWTSFNGLYVYDNRFINFRYKALSFGGQPDYRDDPSKVSKNYDILTSGNQHDAIFLSGNTCLPGPLTERGTVGVSATDYVRLYDDNNFDGFVTLDTKTNHRYNGLKNGTEEFYVKDGPPDWMLSKYDDALGNTRSMTEQEIGNRLVRY